MKLNSTKSTSLKDMILDQQFDMYVITIFNVVIEMVVDIHDHKNIVHMLDV